MAHPRWSAKLKSTRPRKLRGVVAEKSHHDCHVSWDDDMDDDIPQLEDTGRKHDITYETMVQSTNESGSLGLVGLAPNMI